MVWVGWTGACQAQTFSGALIDAVRITIENEPTIAAGKQRVAAGVAAVTLAAAVFDTTLNAGFGRAVQNTPVLAGQQSSLGPGISNFSNSYFAGATRKLRSGVLLQPSLSVFRTLDNLNYPTAPMRSDATLQVLFPLLRGSGTAVNTAPERAAQLELEAAQLSYRHEISTSVTRTVSAYWDYVSAHRSLAVQRESVARSQRLLLDARRLARADEIPPADVLKYEARLSRDRLGAINQAQAVHQASADLLRAMGLRKTEAELAPPSDGFPDVLPASVQHLLSPAAAGRIQEMASVRRGDVLALQRRRQAAQTLLEAAQGNPASQLDMKVGVGYSGLTENRSAASPWSAFRSSPGANASISLNYEFPVSGQARRAEVSQRLAALELARIAHGSSQDALQRNLAVQLERLDELVAQRRLALEQVDIQRRVSENERRRYGAGFVTAFELLAAEEQLTQEGLLAVAASRRLAQAIVSLRFEAGLLLDIEVDDPMLPLGKLMSLPTSEELKAP
jgi:outer membrane protein TolC